MSFNFRSGGTWNTPTIKRRNNGQWVEIGGGSGDGSDGSDQNEWNPDTNVYEARLPLGSWADTGRQDLRDGETIVIDDSHDLESEINALNEGDILRLKAGTYDAAWIDSAPSHITIRGDDPANPPTITGTVNSYYAFATGDASYSDTTPLVGTPTGYTDPNVAEEGNPEYGDTSIDVSDGSIFSAGDGIVIWDDDLEFRQRPPDGEELGGSGSGKGTSEWNEVESVDGDTLNLVWPISQWWWDNFNATVYRMGDADWNAVDVRLYALDLDRTSGDRGLEFRGCKDLWFEDLTITNGDDQVRISDSIRTRVHNSTFDSSDDKVILTTNKTDDWAFTDLTFRNTSNRNLYFAGTRYYGHAWNIYVDNCNQEGGGNSGPLANAHWGNGLIWMQNCSAEDILFRTRTYSIEIRDCTSTHDGTATVHRGTQRMAQCDFRNIRATAASNDTLNFKYSTSDADNGPHEQLYYENIVCHTDTKMFDFESSTDPKIDTLEIWDSYKTDDPTKPLDEMTNDELYDVDMFLNEDNGYNPDIHMNFLIQGEDPEDHL